MKLKINNKGVSLPMTIGLLLLLTSMTATINGLVIRALRSSHQIEASDKAYFAAEAGIEDALYELSAHTAGYETGFSLGEADARNDNFSQTTIKWNNQWEISNRGLNTCTDSLKASDWVNSLNPQFCGQLYEGEKLVINLFSDDALSQDIASGQVNEAGERINTLNVSSITIRFRIPRSIITKYPGAFNEGLLIDNDGDLGRSEKSGPPPASFIGLNEDGSPDYLGTFYEPVLCDISGTVPVDDNDCDRLEDEDSAEDPVILWKIVDGSGHTFQPLRGCKGSPIRTPGHNNASLCENSFSLINNELLTEIYFTDEGTDENGNIKTIQTFLAGYAGSHDTLQMEILVAAPLEAVNQTNGSEILLPYLDYGIKYSADISGVDTSLPSTFFSLRADGYYQDFKQSITTKVVPRATTRLLDLTIIQQ